MAPATAEKERISRATAAFFCAYTHELLLFVFFMQFNIVLQAEETMWLSERMQESLTRKEYNMSQ